MESRQERSKVPGESQNHGARLLARSILIQAVRDLGRSGLTYEFPVAFLRSMKFDSICSMADWDKDWVIEIFESIDSLGDNVRGKVISDVVTLLKSRYD